MSSVRALIFDDDDAQLVEVVFALEEEWQKFRWPNGDTLPELVPTKISDRTELLRVLRAHNLNEQFEFFLCDIYVGNAPAGAIKAGDRRPDETEGFRFLKTAKEHKMPLCFAITTGQWGSHEAFQKSYNEFSQFIDAKYLKGTLRGVHEVGGPQKVMMDIAIRLRDLGIIRNFESQLTFSNRIQESRTLAIVDELGAATINALVSDAAFRGATSVSLSSLSPGLSGAKVLKLTYSGPMENFNTRPVLLKVSRDRASLQRELDNFRIHIREPGRHVLRTIAQPRNAEKGPAESNGWYAISFECAAPALSLVEWLTSDPSPSEDSVQQLLESFFWDGGLADMYSTTAQANMTSIAAVNSSLLSEYRRMAILESVHDFQPLLSKHLKGKFSHLDDLLLFLEHSRLEGVEERDLSKRLASDCLVHGDLHARNVLVTSRATREQGVLIDLASMRMALWTVDLVRLLCDIFVSGWDKGSPSLEWSGLKAWFAQLGILARHSQFPAPPITSPENRAVRSAIDWLFTNRFNVAGLKEDTNLRAEFSLSLGVEFARASYRDKDLSAPKRAFALVAANALILESRKLFSSKREAKT